jgi:hypothetical protein
MGVLIKDRALKAKFNLRRKKRCKKNKEGMLFLTEYRHREYPFVLIGMRGG